MQAYNFNELYNLYAIEQAKEALQKDCIHKESYAKIKQAFPFTLYTPNLFIRIALALLTIVSVIFSGLLLWLISSASKDEAIITLLIILAGSCYVVLEIFTRTKKFYNAGVDNILLCMALIFFISTFFIRDEISWTLISGAAMVISFYLCLRFTDAFMAIVSYCLLIVLVFLLYIKIGDFAKATAPLLMMALSAFTYFIMLRLSEKTIIYRFCCKTVMFATLVSFYGSGNYFVVTELSNEMYALQLSLQNAVAFGWLFWLFTFIIPPAYMVYGIRHKNFLFMRTGLVLVAATIFTIRYYYHLMPIEIVMLMGGIFLLVISYLLIKYLGIPKGGFTSVNVNATGNSFLNAEALIVAETFNKQPGHPSPGLYEGGSSGGGGATGEF